MISVFYFVIWCIFVVLVAGVIIASISQMLKMKNFELKEEVKYQEKIIEQERELKNLRIRLFFGIGIFFMTPIVHFLLWGSIPITVPFWSWVLVWSVLAGELCYRLKNSKL
jgi:hypothetical protein